MTTDRTGIAHAFALMHRDVMQRVREERAHEWQIEHRFFTVEPS
jgi:hypothetical protein